MDQMPIPDKDESFLEEIKSGIRKLLNKAVTWMKPDKEQPTLVQILVFIIKLPILLLMLLLSPVLLVILIFVFMAAF
ncbi:hypothetical protein L0U88_08265 [Flavihumibacter sp. RY-1]|uniref:DUF4342 domain-containing protein n=1 Tax=Flavihumibacter fluminis TaxID=2909236 RepID=A0ABS9BGC7_9BACT|nr:hypothetical protein [Flavihumibacter fluminis]MCF1714616.1 hypothetical protein [Flavihumibacter fluminis]